MIRKIPLITTVLSFIFPLSHSSVLAREVMINQLQSYNQITISGTITSVVGNDFVVQDSTGEIIVDAGPVWYHNLNLKPGQRVSVTGKYDGYELDAFQISFDNGEVIKIRESRGKPPWAGGRNRGGFR